MVTQELQKETRDVQVTISHFRIFPHHPHRAFPKRERGCARIRLALIIARIDADESLDPAGAYTIMLRP
jgi:hypothetical protein